MHVVAVWVGGLITRHTVYEIPSRNEGEIDGMGEADSSMTPLSHSHFQHTIRTGDGSDSEHA